MKYRCIKEMYLEKVDEDGFHIPNECAAVPVGSIWNKSNSTIIGGEVHLDCESGADDAEWIEVSRKSLAEFFETIGGEPDDKSMPYMQPTI